MRLDPERRDTIALAQKTWVIKMVGCGTYPLLLHHSSDVIPYRLHFAVNQIII